METRTLVEANAKVTTIVQLSKGDVYKRLEKASTYSQAKLKYGVVTDVLANGEDSVITSLEYEAEFRSMKVEAKVFGTNDELMIFVADADEFQGHVGDLITSCRQGVNEAERTLAEKRSLLERAEALTELKVTNPVAV